MDVQELKAERDTLSKAVTELIKEFESKTETTVTEVQLSRFKVGGLRSTLSHAELKVDFE